MMLDTSEQLLHTWEPFCLLPPAAGAGVAPALSSGNIYLVLLFPPTSASMPGSSLPAPPPPAPDIWQH